MLETTIVALSSLVGFFGFSHVCVSEIMKILDNFDTNKAAGIDGLSGIFIKKTVQKYCLNQSPIL